jgi:hypothetical protein
MFNKHDIVIVIEEAKSFYPIPVEGKLEIVDIIFIDNTRSRILVRHLLEEGQEEPPWGVFEALPQSLRKISP